ncbi:Type VII secretion protein EccC OS=Streptomyces microflavus OX=1919 GN=Smic_63900 PE=4 SV=1 [Streptomyces microflavus]
MVAEVARLVRPFRPAVRMLRSLGTDTPGAWATEGGGMRLALGLDQDALEPVWHDFSRTPHLIAVGDTEGG